MTFGRRRILAVTGSRADYGLLYWPMKLIGSDPAFELTVAATGMHLSPAFGMTVDQIVSDGFPVAARVETLSDDDTGVGMAHAIGRGVAGFADALGRLKPELVLVLGDRFEIFAAVQAAFVSKSPIAHLCGGDVTDGALDDAFRHSMSKMASLHFPTTADAARRLRQLGEAEERIFTVGSPGIDAILRVPVMSREELGASLGHELPKRYLLATFHPATLDAIPSADQLEALLGALRSLPADIGVIFTLSNADSDGRALGERIRRFAVERPDVFAHVSLGTARYLNLMRHAVAVIGNSSSGLYEAPSFGIPSVNIGRRQEGRLRAASVIDVPPELAAITHAIDAALSRPRSAVVNPYGDGRASERIVAALKSIPDWASLVYKRFQDL